LSIILIALIKRLII